MTKVVKSVAVVDDRQIQRQMAEQESWLTGQTVIKSKALYGTPAKQEEPQPTTQQDYIDQLNRLKVDIAQSKAQLRVLSRELKEKQAYNASLEYEQAHAADPEEHAQGILDQARQQAKKIIEEAESQGRIIQDQAQNEGYLQGFSEGYEAAKAEFIAENQPRADHLRDLVEQLSVYQRQMERQSEQDLIAVVLAAVKKIIGREMSGDPQTVVDMLRGAVEDNRREEFVKITLAPDLLPVEAQANEEIRGMLEDLGANVAVVTDDELESGACTVETPGGIIDVSISTQLNNIASVLEEA